MTTARAVVDVGVAPAEAFELWARPEVRTRLLSGVQDVRRGPDGLWHWTVDWGGRPRSFDTMVVERRAPRLLALRSVQGPLYRERARFTRIGPECTQLHLELTVEPRSVLEQGLHWIGWLDSAVERDLQRFADLAWDEHQQHAHAPAAG